MNEITEEYKKKKSEGPVKKGVIASIIASVKKRDPYVLMNDDIRGTMTKEDKANEESDDVCLPFDGNALIKVKGNMPTFDTKFLKKEKQMPKLNFTTGDSAFCIDSLIHHNELLKARNQIKKEQQNGLTLNERLKTSKRITTGILVKAGSHCIGKTVFDIVKEQQKKI